MDIYAFRVIVNSVDDCYRGLGQMHSLYKPRPGKVKDYIAVPRANGYQALQTSMIGPHGVPVEVHLQTEEMEQVAEMGITAHWVYKEGGKNDSTTAQCVRNVGYKVWWIFNKTWVTPLSLLKM